MAVRNMKGLREKADSIQQLCGWVDACTRCPLHRTRQNTVPGVGAVDASIMVVGEAPGAREDAAGEPFVGPAGKLFNRLLHHAGLKRQDLFITNVIKCRPPDNRQPSPAEAKACLPFLRAQIAVVSPKVIVTLGRVAGCYLALTFTSMGSLLELDDPHYEHEGIRVPVVPLYHPAYLLRLAGTPRGKEVARDSRDRLIRARELAGG